MRAHEILRQVFKTHPPKQLAEVLGVSESLLYKWAEPHGVDQSGAPSPLERIAQLVEATANTQPVEWLCERAGGYFVLNPDGAWKGPKDLVRATNHVVQLFADLLQEIARAAADNRISPEESKKIRREWQELKSLVETFVRSCEEGDFASIETEVRKLARE